jgi:hypothetical protein
MFRPYLDRPRFGSTVSEHRTSSIAAQSMSEPTQVFRRWAILSVLLLVGLGLLGRGLEAQTAESRANSAGTAAKQSNVPKLQPLPSVRNPKVITPFDRLLAPRMYETMRQAAAKGIRPSATAKPHAMGTGTGGTNVNFPGFVAAPYATLNAPLGNSYESYATVAGDFNNDGYPDVASVQSGGILSVVLNPGAKGNIAQGKQMPLNNTVNAFTDVFWLATADFNGDGNLDIVGVDDFGSQLFVWLGNGDGTFQNAVSYPVKFKSTAGLGIFGGGSSIQVGDFNGDGKPDIAIVALGYGFEETPVSTMVFINDGKGNLAAGKETDSNFKDSYAGALTGQSDIITDGTKITGIALLLADEAFANSANSGIDLIVIASNGDGTFAPAVEPTAPLLPNDQPYIEIPKTNLVATSLATSTPAGSSKATTDLVFITGDGAVYDSPITAQSGSFAVTNAQMIAGANAELQSDGRSDPLLKRSASQPATAPAPAPFPFLQAINVADVNGDGYPDLFVYTSGSVYVYLNGGDGTFSTQPIQLVGGFAASEQPQPQDFNKSGHVSFVEFDSQILQFAYFQGDGTGHFYAAAGVSGKSDATGYATDDDIVVQAAADFNGDGLTDVVAQDWSNAGTTASNGYPDIVLGINNGATAPANESNNFTFTRILTGAQFAAMNGAFVQPVTVANPTGGYDVLISTTDGGLYSIAIDKGVASAPSVVLPPGEVQCTVNFADAGDINGDGIADIVVAYGGAASCGANGAPSAYLTFFGNPDGTFHQAGFTAFGNQLYQVRLIDFNGDGSPDLAVSDNAGNTNSFSVSVIPNKNDGSGSFNTSLASVALQNYVATDIIPGDYNQDGKQDLTVATEGQVDSTGTLVLNSWGLLLAPGNGDFTFGTPTTIDTGYWPAWGSYADFNGDGTPDLALAVYGDTTTIEDVSNVFVPSPPIVQVLPNLGGGAFAPAIGEFDGFNFDLEALRYQTAYTYSAYTFTGNFGSGSDLLVSGFYNSAEFLNQGTDSLTLTTSASTGNQGTNVTLTATLKQAAANPNPPTGAVSFFDNGTLLGAADLTSTGTASLTTDELPVGSDALTAVYAGDAHNNAAQGAVSIAITAIAPDFTLSATTPSVSLQQGATGVVTLALTANSTFSEAITFACSGAPAEATCTVNPASLSLTPGQSGTATVVVATSASGGSYQAHSDGLLMKSAGGVSVAGLLLLVVPRRKRLPWLMSLIAVVGLSLGAMSMSGCQGGGNPGTAVGSSTLTVTATAGTVSHSQTITVQITKAQ